MGRAALAGEGGGREQIEKGELPECVRHKHKVVRTH